MLTLEELFQPKHLVVDDEEVNALLAALAIKPGPDWAENFWTMIFPLHQQYLDGMKARLTLLLCYEKLYSETEDKAREMVRLRGDISKELELQDMLFESLQKGNTEHAKERILEEEDVNGPEKATSLVVPKQAEQVVTERVLEDSENVQPQAHMKTAETNSTTRGLCMDTGSSGPVVRKARQQTLHDESKGWLHRGPATAVCHADVPPAAGSKRRHIAVEDDDDDTRTAKKVMRDPLFNRHPNVSEARPDDDPFALNQP